MVTKYLVCASCNHVVGQRKSPKHTWWGELICPVCDNRKFFETFSAPSCKNINETHMPLAQTFDTTGDPNVVQAPQEGLREKRTQEVTQAYELEFMQLQKSDNTALHNSVDKGHSDKRVSAQLEMPLDQAVSRSQNMQETEEGKREGTSAGWVNALAVITSPLKDYWQALKRFNSPDVIEWIKSVHLASTDVINLVISSAVVTTAIARIIHYDEGSLEFTDIPILNELVVVGVFLIFALVSAVICHKPLRLVGGKGEFRHAVVASIYVSMIFIPIIVLAEGIYFHITGKQLPPSTYAGGTQAAYAMLLAQIHKLSIQKTMLVIGAASIAFLFFVAGITFLFV